MMNVQPPKWPLLFLRWFCREKFIEEIEGNLIELFFRQYKLSPRKARIQFTWNVIRHFRPEFMKPINVNSNYNSIAMIRNYFITASRFLLRNLGYTLINVFGLAVGTLSCLYIILYVQDQYSYDKHHKEDKSIYRVNRLASGQGNTYNLAITPAALTPAMKHDFPEVSQFTRVVPLLGIEKHMLRYNEKAIWEKDAFFVDSTFFDVFTYRSVAGNLQTALANPYSVVLNKSTAEKLFGKQDPVGKTISIENTQGKNDYRVTAVVDESFGKSHLHANIFITMNGGGVGEFMLHNNSWTNEGYIASYVKLFPGTNSQSLQKKLPAFIDHYAGADLKKWGAVENYYLQPISSIHTTTGLDNPGIGKPVNPVFLAVLAVIAILIQLIACINFMNLSTARASKRAKEVGVRKVIGARRGNLVKQFLGESFLLSFIGVLIALPLLWMALPYLNALTKSNIRFALLTDYKIQLMLAGLVIVTGLVAGSYPAFYLSAFNTVKVIKGNFTSKVSAAGIRRVLVVFQFSLSIVLIIGIIIIYSQLRFIKNKDLGFDPDQRLIFTFNSESATGQIPSFMNDLREVAGVKEVSNASRYLSNSSLFFNGFSLPGGNEKDSKATNYIISDEYFVKANGIKMVTGRDFIKGDSAKVLINETYAKQLGLKPAMITGTHLHDSQGRDVEIVGVMKDFNFWSLHQGIDAFLLMINNPHADAWHTLVVHTNTNNYKELLGKIETAWKKDIKGIPFEYSFLDEAVQKQYETDITLSNIISSFTIIAVLISCLGLFGLASFSAEQRSKEIGIRKVLGASVTGIVRMLSQDFLKLVGIAFVIASPIAWWGTRQWLQAFSYRTPVTWWMFAAAGLLVLIVTLLTVSVQSIRAAIVNPVKSLRSEG